MQCFAHSLPASWFDGSLIEDEVWKRSQPHVTRPAASWSLGWDRNLVEGLIIYVHVPSPFFTDDTCEEKGLTLGVRILYPSILLTIFSISFFWVFGYKAFHWLEQVHGRNSILWSCVLFDDTPLDSPNMWIKECNSASKSGCVYIFFW